MVQPTAKNKGVKRSHMVWQHYLNSFAIRGIIYGKNKETGDIFESSTENIAVSKNYYKLDDKIKSDDIFLYKEIFYSEDKISEAEEYFLNGLIAFLNNDLPYFIYSNKKKFVPELKLENIIDKNVLLRNQEELFTFYEENFYEIYHLLLNKDASFYNKKLIDRELMIIKYENSIHFKTMNFLYTKSADLLSRVLNEYGKYEHANILQKNYKSSMKIFEKIIKNTIHMEDDLHPYYFLSFFLTQNCRVSKSIKNMLSLNNKLLEIEDFKEYRGRFNFKSIGILFTHAHIYRLGKNLIFKNYKIIIIENKSTIPFITSDNPVINIYALYIDAERLQEDQMEFYYPLSSQVALLFTNKQCYENVDIIYAYNSDVKMYNKILFDMSEKFVYSSDKAALALL